MRFLALFISLAFISAGCDGAPPGPRGLPSDDRSVAAPSVRASTPEGSAPGTVAEEQTGHGSAGHPGRTYVVWTPGGLTEGAERELSRMPGVMQATEVTGGLMWMTGATSGNLPVKGYEIPIEVAFVSPRELAQVFPGAPKPLHLRPDNLHFSRTGFSLRGTDRGAFALESDQGSFTGRCCTSDWFAMGYEALTAGAPPDGWGSSYALVRASRRPALADVQRAAGAGPWRVESRRSTNFLRYADAVAPQMFLKERFGEFSARPSPDGSLDIEPQWLKQSIVREEVPVLGEVECHRRLIDQMRTALEGVTESGLSDEIKPEEYAGCFNARFIGRDPSGRISSHAWGAAFDVAAASNPLGAPPTLDLRLVGAFRKAGFNWGGKWLIPDGMHFEWGRPQA